MFTEQMFVNMTLSLSSSVLSLISQRWPLLLYAATWTTVLTTTVTLASFSPEWAFIYAVTPDSSFSRVCPIEGCVRIPLDTPDNVFCLPAQLFRRSEIDLLVPPIFAAIVVASSAYLVRAFALWEADEER